MDLNKFKEAFNSMNYDLRDKLKITLREIHTTFIVTESADLETATDFIAAVLSSEDTNLINSILVQESVNKKFTELLTKKVKGTTATNNEISQLSSKGFEVIGSRIVRCTRNLIDEKSAAVSLEVFRTTKEGIYLAKSASSISLWCEKLSIAFEYINALNVQQIWLNSSFGSTNPKIPFLSENNQIVCDEELKKSIANGNQKNALLEVSGNIQFQTTFQTADKKFKTVVIPFGETFAN